MDLADDMSLATRREFSVHRVPEDFYFDGGWHLPRQQGTGHVLLMDRFFPVDFAITIHPGTQITPDQEPALQALITLIQTTPVHRRLALYTKLVQPYEPEKWMLRRHYSEELQRRHILPSPSPYAQCQEWSDPQTGRFHVLWRGPSGPSHPAINIWGTHDLPIYRVLWPWYMPNEPIPDGRTPVHDRTRCEFDAHSETPCVYPGHFRLFDPTRRIPTRPASTASRRRVSGAPSVLVHWRVQDGVTYCEPKGHRLGDRYQSGTLPTNVYCPGCYQDRQDFLRRGSSEWDAPATREETRILDELDDLLNLE